MCFEFFWHFIAFSTFAYFFFLSLSVSYSFSILFVLHQKDREIHSLAYLLLLTFSIIFSAYMFFLLILLLFHLHQLLLLVSSIAEVDNETRNGTSVTIDKKIIEKANEVKWRTVDYYFFWFGACVIRTHFRGHLLKNFLTVVVVFVMQLLLTWNLLYMIWNIIWWCGWPLNNWD